MKYWFVIGTAAELIKVYPLMVEAEKRGIDWMILATGQSEQNLYNQIKDFDIAPEKIVRLLKNSSDLKKSTDALVWIFKVFLLGLVRAYRFIAANKENAVIVHGDTLSTLVGAIIGKLTSAQKIVHIEAGMRSGNIWAPFPEEINRRLVSRLATYHMVSDNNALENLRREKTKGKIVVTNGNTVVDALALAGKNITKNEESYVLFNIHRFENLHNESRWLQIMELMLKISQNQKVVFVLMPSTRAKLESNSVLRNKIESANIKLVNRMPYMQFSKLLYNCQYLVTDGGSNQQECYYIGLPCLIMREVTESIEGIGQNCVLSKFEPEIINNFILNIEKYRREAIFPEIQPSHIVWEKLIN